ncbi:MAG: RNA methyltransferase [Rhodothermales bacterium]
MKSLDEPEWKPLWDDVVGTRHHSPWVPDPFTIDGIVYAPDEIIAVLRPYLTDERADRIDAVLQQRTYSVLPVLEHPHDRGNVGAIMRSAEALGYQRLDLIGATPQHQTPGRTPRGAHKWLDVHIWHTTTDCLSALKADGYAIVATHLDDRAQPIASFDFTQKTVLLLGNERRGASEEALALADATCIIPIAGFSESYNVSVAAALALYHAQQDRLRRQGFHGDLSAEAFRRLEAAFYLRAVQHAHPLLKRSRA